jgi:hypothetical protein
MDCFNNLVGLKTLCTSTDPAPQFYLDDIEGINQDKLSSLASPSQATGKALASDIIASAIRIMSADLDSIIPANFRMTNEIVNVCSTNTFSGFYSSASTLGTGIIVKNITGSKFSRMLIDSITAKVYTDGEFTLTIDDGDTGNLKTITHTFVAGQETIFQNVGYSSTAKQVKMYFNNAGVSLAQIITNTTSGCGCGGNKSTMAKDIVMTGLSSGVETIQQYAILPCVTIACSYDAIVCQLVSTSPRIFGLALLYLCASKIFENNSKSVRVNRQASFQQEEQKSDSQLFYEWYLERLRGKPAKGILGITQAINNNLALIKDKCVTCGSNPVGVAWAAG